MTTNSELAARRARAVPRGVGSATSNHAARAENAELWDEEGRRYWLYREGLYGDETHPAWFLQGVFA